MDLPPLRLTLARLSFGVGDRFGRQAAAQLRAFQLAAERGIDLVPVWNKSNREHRIVGSAPSETAAAARAAVAALGWTRPYHVDADHIGLESVEPFLPACDFFTLDVAEHIDRPIDPGAVETFLERHPELSAEIEPGRADGTVPPAALAGLPAPALREAARRYLGAAREAGRIYRHIELVKGPGRFITEVSLDETDRPQSPAELRLVLAALADEGVPLQTIAPRFAGRFNKGVDYIGDAERFETELRAHLAMLGQAVRSYGLPPELKLSIHSGSDKFAIYPAVRRVLADTGAGVHVKTAGTSWLEECIGLAEHGGAGLALVAELYAGAFERREELCAPYATVIDIDPARLPPPAAVRAWTSEQFVEALRHDEAAPAYDPGLRQLLHVGYKVAAEMGARYLALLDECRETVARNVTDNLLQRHMVPLFLGTRVTAAAEVPLETGAPMR